MLICIETDGVSNMENLLKQATNAPRATMWQAKML